MLTSRANFGTQTNSVGPDQTATSSLILVHTVCYRDVLNKLADDIAEEKQAKSNMHAFLSRAV